MNSASPGGIRQGIVSCDRGPSRWSCRLRIGGLALAVLLASLRNLPAETKQISLPASYVDFAISPDTGDVAAINSGANSITLFRGAYLKGDKKALAGPIAIGKTPSSVCFKRFADKSYFAVVCTQDSNLYLLDAVQLTLAKKISLTKKGSSVVTCSQNPQDPYIYYSF